MATTLSTFRAQVDILLGPNDSNTELADGDIDQLIKAAVERYSRDRPEDATTDVTGDGGKYYAVAASLTSWVEDYSAVLSIEYPAQAISADTTPQYLDSADWRDDYWSGGTRYLFLPNHSPAATETLRVRYSVPYTWSGDPQQTTIPTQDFYAICHLAAGYCCQAIATKFSRTSDSTITADAVNHTSRAAEFAQRAREYIAFYERHLGLDTDPTDGIQMPAAGQFIDLDNVPGWPLGRDYLFHGRETR